MDVDIVGGAREWLAEERSAISDLRDLLARMGAPAEDLAQLRTALEDLDGIFMLVVVGEYNAGKSTLLNALLGEPVMPQGVTPTTDRITIITYGREEREEEAGEFVLRRTYPAEVLQDLALVDTPGTNAVLRHHQELTERFIPRADLVLFVTSADRPFTESERAFLDLIGDWGKKVTIVVNKLDILEGPEERERVLEFVQEHARATLGVTPPVFGVMAKPAFRARRAGDAGQLAGTGLPELEGFIEGALADGERLRLKLLSPLGVGEHIAEVNSERLESRLELLADDRRTLEQIDRQRQQFERDLRREFESYLGRVKTVLLEVERRGEVFFDDTVRLGNVLGLMNAERVREAFESRVVRGADREIDLAVSEMVDWFIQRNLSLWEDVMTFINERRKAGSERVIGEVGGRFQYDRDALIRSMRERAEEVMAGFDEREEAVRLADQLQGAVVQSGLMQVGGLGLGAAVVAFLSGAAFDVTGITLGLTIAGLGLLVIPRRRAAAKRQLHEKMQELRDGLEESLTAGLEKELQRAAEKLSGTIAPYTRFVRSEFEHLEALQEEIEAITARLRAVRREVSAAA